MRVLIITVALVAISHAHLIPLAARAYNADEWQQIQDEAREAAEELANKLEEAKWDALDKAWDVADHYEQDNYNEKTFVELPNQYAPVVHGFSPAEHTVVAHSSSHPGPPSHIATSVFGIGNPDVEIIQPAVEIIQPAVGAVAVAPATKTSVVTQSLSQTHPAPYSSGYISAPALQLSQPAIAISQPALALTPATKTSVVTQSLSQTHPPSIPQGHAILQPAVEIAQPAVEIAQPAVEIAQRAVEIAQPALAISPASKTTVVTQSLSQTHPPSVPQGHAIAQPALELTVPVAEYEFKHAYPSVEIAPAAIIQPETKTVVTQSLDQTHPETWPKAEIAW